VLQWKYVGGNNWGICPDGNGAVGCGEQEEFRACSDIAIGKGSASAIPTIKPPTKVKPTTEKWPTEENEIDHGDHDDTYAETAGDNNKPSNPHFDPESSICDNPSKCTDDTTSNQLDEGNHKPQTSTSTTMQTTSMRPANSPSFQTIQVPDKVNPLTGPYKLVCYFTNWAWYRPGIGKYLPDDVDANLCTHIVYGFAVLNYDELTIRTYDSWADIDNKFYERVVDLKKRGIKVTLAIGGWNDSEGDKYSRLVRSATARAKFVQHVVEFLEKFGFDGLDLDWVS
jgi:Glycosyl hydrolases family 18